MTGKPPYKGDPLRIDAGEYRRMQAMLREFEQLKQQFRQASRRQPANVIKLTGWNRSGSDLLTGSVVEYNLAAWNGTDFEQQRFNRQWEFDTPTADGIAAGRIGILLEPIKDDGFGRIGIQGPVYALMDVDDSGDTHATPEASSTELATGTSGTYPIIQKLGTGTGSDGIVLLGSANGPSPSTDGITLAQAPAGGVPAMTGVLPGEASCELIKTATEFGTGYQPGDLITHNEFVIVRNWTNTVLGDRGSRLIMIAEPNDGALLVGAICNDEGTASDIKREFASSLGAASAVGSSGGAGGGNLTPPPTGV